MNRWTVLGTVTCALFVVAGCAGAHPSVGRVPAGVRTAKLAPVSASGSCPRTLGASQDVAKQTNAPSDRLLPTALPVAALVCGFDRSRNNAGSLSYMVRLDRAKARVLAKAIAHVSLKPASGTFGCPQDDGSATVLAFADGSDGTVDLWYYTSGCQTLDNGDTLAFQGGNPSFDDRFQTVFDSIVKPPPR